MLRITPLFQNNWLTVLKLDGRVSGEAVDLLATEIDHYLQECQRVVLELGDVKYIDQAGLAMLQHWSRPRLEFRQAKAYIRSVLLDAGLKHT